MARTAVNKDPAAAALGRKRSKRAKDAILPAANDSSDAAVIDLLNRLKATNDDAEVRRLSDEIHRAVFHKQFNPA